MANKYELSNTYISICKISLVIASIVYLAVEVVFNMTLLEVISRADVAKDVFHGVEEFGRRASSTGFTFFAVGLFVSTGYTIRHSRQWVILFGLVLFCSIPFVFTPYSREALFYVAIGSALAVLGNRFFSHNIARSLLTVIGISLLSWPSFYYGKIAVIDNWVIDPSSGKQRLAAHYVPLLRQGLSNGSLQLEDISLEDFGGNEHPEAKAFLVMLGPLALNAESLTRWVSNEQNMKRTVRKIITSSRMVNVESEYANYLKKRTSFKTDQYDKYAQGSADYLNRNTNLTLKAEKGWLAVQDRIDTGWDNFKISRTRFLDKHIKKAEKHYGSHLESFFKDRGKCRDRKCRDRLDKDYRNRMSRIKNPPPDWSIFCVKGDDPRKKVENPFVILTGAFIYQILSLVIDGDRQYYNCNHSREYWGTKLAVYDHDTFDRAEKNKLKLPFSLDKINYVPINLEYFLASDAVSRDVRKALKKDGLNLPSTWRVTDQATYNRTLKEKTDKEAKTKWNNKTRKQFGDVIPAGLSMDDFTRLNTIQENLKKKMGKDYVRNFIFSWSEALFAKKVIQPRIESRVKEELRKFNNDQALYANGGKFEEKGKEALRASIVPPIAVALSLLFSFLSASKVLVSLFSIFTGKILTRPKFKKIMNGAIWIPSMLAIGGMPFVITNEYAESSGWKILSSETAEKSWVLAQMADYTIRVQPVLASAGYPLMQVFDPYDMSPHKTVQNPPQSSISLPPSKTKEEVKWVQKKLGLDVDGVAGEKTYRAVTNYRKAHGLPPGRIDDNLMRHMAEQPSFPKEGASSKSQLAAPNPSSTSRICNQVEYWGHRGGAGGVENSLGALKRAKEFGYSGVEIDAQPLKDGTWVVHHDYKTGRTVTSYKGSPLLNLTKKQWLAARMTDGEHPPFLDSALAVSSVPVNIEIKGGTCDQVKTMAQKAVSSAPTVSFSSLQIKLLQCVRSVLPDVYLGYISPPAIGAILDEKSSQSGGLKKRIIKRVIKISDKIDHAARLKVSEAKSILGKNSGYHVDVETLIKVPRIIPVAKKYNMKVLTYGLHSDHTHRSTLQKLKVKPDGMILDKRPQEFCQ